MKWLLLLSIGLTASAQAQGYGATTYKCVEGSKVEYSDNRCAGATILGRTKVPGGGPTARASEGSAGPEPPSLKTEPAPKTTAPGPTPNAAPLPKSIVAVSSCSELEHRAATELDPVALYKARKRFQEMKCQLSAVRR